MFYIATHEHHFRFFYYALALGLGCFFTPLNVLLLVRILAADNFLGDWCSRYAASKRDVSTRDEKKSKTK